MARAVVGFDITVGLRPSAPLSGRFRCSGFVKMPAVGGWGLAAVTTGWVLILLVWARLHSGSVMFAGMFRSASLTRFALLFGFGPSFGLVESLHLSALHGTEVFVRSVQEEVLNRRCEGV